MSVLLLLGLWSLTAWLLHATAAWAVTHAGALGGAAASAAGAQLPSALPAWIPVAVADAARELAGGLQPLVSAVLQALPAMGDVLTVAAWLLWALGAALLLGLGAIVHAVIAVLRRRSLPALRGPTGLTPT
jgi:hypothetical protein